MPRKVAACIDVFEQLLIGANIDTTGRCTTRKGIHLIDLVEPTLRYFV